MCFRRTYLLAIVAFMALSGIAAAQNLYSAKTLRDKLDAARSLYYNGAFPAAEQAFSALAAESAGCDYLTRSEIEAYRVLCNISMDRVNAQWSLKVFADKYPNAPEMPMLQFRMASRLFDGCEYDKASSYFENIRESDLYSDWRTEFRFKRAFCRMRSGKRAEAAEGFRSVIDAPHGIFTYPSIYYLGYVKYADRDFDAAVPLFEKASADSRFRLMSQYYCVESRFLQNDWDYVIDKAPALYEILPDDLKVNVARILSESYFRKGDSSRAADYLEKLRGSSSGFSRKDLYFSGYLAYGMGLYDKALEDFSNVPGVPDSLSQNAWYRMADCYLKKGNRNAALDAFLYASQIDADPAVKEDAYFNYARLCFELNSDFSKFEDFSKTFPDSGRGDAINEYMAASCIQSKDYALAVDALRKIKAPTRESVANLQKAAYLKAMQYIAGGSYSLALPMLELSEVNGAYNKDLLAEATFWRGECLYRTEKYDEAAAIMKSLIADSRFKSGKRYPQAVYTLAYCCAKTERYDEAVSRFDEYLSLGEDMPFGRDAALRKADACFMAGDYVKAAGAYDRARNEYPSADIYPAFRAAVSYGLVGNTSRKIEILSQVRTTGKNQPLYARSLLELGRACELAGRRREASECFEDILTMRGDSSCFSAALLEMAQWNAKSGDNDRAVRYYKRIVEDCPLSDELSAAISGLEGIYQATDRPADFLAYLDEVGMSDVRDGKQKESMLFKSASSLFNQGRYGRAVSALQSYLTEYGNSANTTEAYYMLAESLRETGRNEAAADNYLNAMRRGGNRKISEAATASYARLSYSMERYRKAVEAYSSLLQLGVDGKTVTSAYLGRMRSYYKDRQWDEAISDGRTLLARSGVEDGVIREVRYTIAKSFIVKGSRRDAAPYLAELAEDCSDEYGAEATYLMIFDSYNNGEFSKVESMVYKFSESGTDQLYWLARSFLVLGDSMAARGETDRARAQYQSIMDTYIPQGEDGILAEAAKRLSGIKEAGR